MFPCKVVPGKKSNGNRNPAIERGLVVKPEPAAKDGAGMSAKSESWQKEPSHEGVASYSNKKGYQAEKLEPVTGRNHTAAATGRLLGEELLSTKLTKHVRLPMGRVSEPVRKSVAQR